MRAGSEPASQREMLLEKEEVSQGARTRRSVASDDTESERVDEDQTAGADSEEERVRAEKRKSLTKLRKEELITLCRSRNLKIGGNKPDLIQRLMGHL